MSNSSGEDDYEPFNIGTSLPKSEELANLYGGSLKTKSPKSPTSPRVAGKVPVLPPLSKQKGADSQAPGNYSLTQPVKVKSKTFKTKKKSIPEAPPRTKPKPTTVRNTELPSVLKKTESSEVTQDDDLIYEEMDPTVVPGELTLEEFVKNFDHTLPQQIEVSKGVYGTDTDSTLSTSDVLNIHCIVKRDLVQMEEKKSKQTYSIPFNSSIKFAPVFNHHDRLEQINKGERFPYVANILDLVIMPKVVCACQPIEFNTDIDPTEYKEILAIKEIIYAESSAQRRKLRVYSFTDNCDKVLDESVYGDFSTRPSDIKLYMQDILKHVTSPFPIHLIMFKDIRVPKMMGVPHHLYQYPLLMTKKFTEVILIATNARSKKQKELEPFEIPITVDVDIQLVKLPDNEYKKLVKETEELKEKLSSLPVKIYQYENMSDEMLRVQTKFYELVRIGGDKSETPLRRGPAGGANRSLVQRIDKLEKTTDNYKESQTRIKADREANDKFQQGVTTRLANQEKLITQQAEQLKKANRQMSMLKKRLRELTRMVHGTDDPGSNEDDDEDFELSDPRPEDAQGDIGMAVSEEENKKHVASMNNQQILELLRANGLKQYESSFLREEVTGELLLECDEHLLQNELGVTSKLHRLRLLRIISGKPI